ncbi:MAG: metallophosphoesterase, partial [Actinobacteria bacterium]|nr:metallophosphoesterase [Actinomycetota bacterium]
MTPFRARSLRAAALLLAAAALLLLAFAPSAGAAGEPRHVHLSWESDASTTTTVSWHTDTGLAGYVPTVRYGTSPGTYSKTSTGASHTYPGATVEVREVELTGLSAASRYYYVCGDPGYGWTSEASFRTAPGVRSAFTFCAYGDSRDGWWPFESGDNSNFEIWEQCTNSIAAQDPLFSIFTADAVRTGDSESKWNTWYDKVAPLSSRSPFMSCHGNHENYEDAFFERIALPGNERWYSFDVGNVHFTCLDSGLTDDGEEALIGQQKPWLEADLAAAKAAGADWLVVYFHRAPYASGSHGDQSDVIAGWIPVFDQYGVDLVFCGHNHYYERTFPLKNGNVVDDDPGYYYKPPGSVYVTAGSVGAPLADFNPGAKYARQEKSYHYCTVEVLANDTMTVTARYGTNGNLLEQFVIDKATPPAIEEVSPAAALVGAQVTISGTDFGDARADSAVWFGDTQASVYTSWSDTEIKALVPASPAGEVQLRVETAIGTSQNEPFTILPGSIQMMDWYFAEGTCRPGFEPYICIQNPGDEAAQVRITYMPGQGDVLEEDLEVGPSSRATVRVKDVLGEGDDPAHDFSAAVSSTNGKPIIVERPLYFDYTGSITGGHDVLGTNTASEDWLFAEGTTHGGFDTWFCLQNPNDSEVVATVTYVYDAEEHPRDVTLPPRSRTTISVNEDLGPARDVAARVEASGPVIVERPMYFRYGGSIEGGHCVIGATEPAREFYFAEGSCRPDFDPYLCL